MSYNAHTAVAQRKKQDITEKDFDCYVENCLSSTEIKALANADGYTTGNLYTYFGSFG